MEKREQERKYMLRAIELAAKGAGWTNPNPMVGAVVVKNDRIIGEGYHEKWGGLHAERNALASLTESGEGATMYVTLEPCCHYGRTPPCTEAIIGHKIGKVVIGSRDPNPLVSGKGAEILRRHGIAVEQDFMRAECDALNPVFFHYITTGKPYVVMKYAMTLDGKIASYTGASKWITGEAARGHVHSLRGRYSAIMAGIGTVLADDPMLNCRMEGGHQPVRIVVDSNLRIPLDSRICRSAKDYPALVACTEWSMEEMESKVKALKALGVKVIGLPAEKDFDVAVRRGTGSHVNLQALMEWLGRKKLDSVLIEGGGKLNEAALRAGIVNHVCAYIGPKILGGAEAKTPVEGLGAASPAQAVQLRDLQISRLGEDLLIEYDVIGGIDGVHWNY